MERIYYKGDGTKETGRRIIAKLESMGGVNIGSLEGALTDQYYFIKSSDGNFRNITYSLPFPPPGYTEASLEEEKVFSKSEVIQLLKDYDESMTSLNVFLATLEPESEFRAPDVTEFRVGFEFEFRKDDGTWVKHKMDSLDYRVSTTMTLSRLQQIYPNRFRVLK